MNIFRVFVELVSYIEKTCNPGTSLFKLSEIHSLYVNRLQDFGISKGFNKTRLKERLLEHSPEAEEHYDHHHIQQGSARNAEGSITTTEFF